MSTMVEVVCKYEHQGSIISSSSSSNKVKWLKHYSSDHRILLVGDGDFSFSLSLAMAFGGASNIVATSLDSYDVVTKKYKAAKTNLEILHSLGAELLHEVDALQMNLHKNLQIRKFDRIIYNFPHAGFLGLESDKWVIMLHRNLVCGFLKNASGMLLPKGEVHVTHKTSEHYQSWNIEELATQNSLTLLERIKFKREDYPGYNNKRGDGKRADEPFHLGECSTYKFVLFPKSNSSNKDGLCYCDPPLRVAEHTSWSKRNPNRRFMGCPKYRGPESEHCKSIEWIDPPLPDQRYKEAMYKLRHERDEKEKLMESLTRQRNEKEAAIEALLEEKIRKEKLMEALKSRNKEIDADKEKLMESLTCQRNEKEAAIKALLEEKIRKKKLMEALKSRNEEIDLYKNGMNKLYKRCIVISVAPPPKRAKKKGRQRMIRKLKVDMETEGSQTVGGQSGPRGQTVGVPMPSASEMAQKTAATKHNLVVDSGSQIGASKPSQQVTPKTKQQTSQQAPKKKTPTAAKPSQQVTPKKKQQTGQQQPPHKLLKVKPTAAIQPEKKKGTTSESGSKTTGATPKKKTPTAAKPSQQVTPKKKQQTGQQPPPHKLLKVKPTAAIQPEKKKGTTSASGSKTTGATPKKKTQSERIVKKKLSMDQEAAVTTL